MEVRSAEVRVYKSNVYSITKGVRIVRIGMAV
jgi:hypothetical protein